MKGREPVPAGAAIHRHQLCGTTPSSCRLPLADAPAPPPDRSSLRTLLVEDDANEQALLSSYLRMNGHSVEAVPDGCAALESLSRRGRPDFLLLDMHMPRMDGPATVAAVRRAPETAGLKIFAVTGSAPGEFDIPAGGVDGWFQKPLNPARLVEAMERACRLH